MEISINPFWRRIKEYYMDNSMYPFWSEMFQFCFLYVNEYFVEISMDQFGEAPSYWNRKSITWKFPCTRLSCSRVIDTVLYTWMSITWKFPWISLARRLKYYMDISMNPFWLRMFDTVLSTWMSITRTWKFSWTVLNYFLPVN